VLVRTKTARLQQERVGVCAVTQAGGIPSRSSFVDGRSTAGSPPRQLRSNVSQLDEDSMKKAYTAPTVVEYGPIADHTFQTPGGVKGCTVNCHLDNFTEQSALATS
jgi:hypothetical protein